MKTIVQSKRHHEFSTAGDSLKIVMFVVVLYVFQGFHGQSMVFHCVSRFVQWLGAPNFENPMTFPVSQTWFLLVSLLVLVVITSNYFYN